MSERKTMKATITKDAAKLWSCESFQRITNSENRGKLPPCAGEEVTLILPGETPSPFCRALRAWKVETAPKSLKNPRGFKVCEHQVDLIDELARRGGPDV